MVWPEEDHIQSAAGMYNEVVNMDKFASGVYFYLIVAIGNPHKGGDDQ